MICKDCICCEHCINIPYYPMTAESEACGDFKHKDRFVELPCKVGDTVWELSKCDDGVYRIFPMMIALIDVYGAFRWDRREQPNVWNIYATSDYTYMYKKFSDIGETLFLTRAEAEQALAERQANDN